MNNLIRGVATAVETPLGRVTSYVMVLIVTVGMVGNLLGESGRRYMVTFGDAIHQPPRAPSSVSGSPILRSPDTEQVHVGENR